MDKLQVSVSHLDVDRLMHEIRQNVTRNQSAGEQIPAPPSQPTSSPRSAAGLRLQPALQINRDNHYHVDDLLKFHGEEFVRNAYRALLLREADAAGLAQHLQTLSSG